MTFLTAARRHLLIAMTLVIAFSSSAYAHDGEHGYLGVMLQSISNSMAKALQLDEDQGVLINKVVEDGPAEAAGLEDGDVILTFNGKDITKHSELAKAVRSTSSGDIAKVEVLHNGKRKTVEVTMGENDDSFFSRSFSDDDDGNFQVFSEGYGQNSFFGGDDEMRWVGGGVVSRWLSDDEHGFMGVELEDISEQLGDFFGADEGEGALVSGVVEDSPAEKSGLKAGDVIVGIDDDEVTSASDVFDLMSDTEADDKVEVAVLRDGKKRTITVTLAEAPENDWAPMQLHSMNLPRAPHAPRHLRKVMRFPQPEILVQAPRHRAKIIELHTDDLSDLKSELNELKKELKELQKELND